MSKLHLRLIAIMGFTNKTLVIIDVGIDDDTGLATLYLEIVRELKRDMFTPLHVKTLGKIWDKNV